MFYLTLSLICCCVVFVQGGYINDQVKNMIKEYMLECVNETGADPQTLKNMQSGMYINDEKVKKQIFCMNKKIGVQDHNGNILVDVIKMYLEHLISDPQKRYEAINTCLVQSSTPEETAFNMQKCLHGYLQSTNIMR